MLGKTCRVRIWSAPMYDILNLFESEDEAMSFRRHLKDLSCWPGECLNGGCLLVGNLRCYLVTELHDEHIWDVRVDNVSGTNGSLHVFVWFDGRADDPTLWILRVVRQEGGEDSAEGPRETGPPRTPAPGIARADSRKGSGGFDDGELALIMKRKQTVLETYGVEN